MTSLQTLILRRFATVGQKAVALDTKIDDSMLSRFLSGERGLKLDQIGPVFDALGLRVVEADGEIVSLPVEELNAYKLLARKALV